MTEIVTPPRFMVRKDASGDHWMVWDRIDRRPARFENKPLTRLANSTAEMLKDQLNNEHNAKPLAAAGISRVRRR